MIIFSSSQTPRLWINAPSNSNTDLTCYHDDHRKVCLLIENSEHLIQFGQFDFFSSFHSSIEIWAMIGCDWRMKIVRSNRLQRENFLSRKNELLLHRIQEKHREAKVVWIDFITSDICVDKNWSYSLMISSSFALFSLWILCGIKRSNWFSKSEYKRC